MTSNPDCSSTKPSGAEHCDGVTNNRKAQNVVMDEIVKNISGVIATCSEFAAVVAIVTGGCRP